ncbi:hypothetical protein SCHIN_v1c07710 [Spiroplasma chinense]|uniref:Thoeris protein ThsB TIR-like domain-containing protein n=1 Tax=Spiroplasma chinense TaxID=216932 RepID=A0A5B9Y5H1_9MOLU|nr:TIR domain-containing protein [Spiroplasma chinense]QEH61966.1 hypothetical protein SCHIN_v1c07710 [Spiroplasma chinense]
MENKIHKVYISFKYTENKRYREALTELNDRIRIFEDWSVFEGDIPDKGLTDEQIRRTIRDEYIREATVLILLNGKKMYDSKFIDWELHAAMYDGEKNKKMGILVINLPEVKHEDCDLSHSGEIENIYLENGEFRTWSPVEKQYDIQRERHKNAPTRLVKNLIRDNVAINFVQWEELFKRGDSIAADRIVSLVDSAFKRRKQNDYDVSDKLMGRKV